MTTWKDGGWYGLLCREITNEAGNRTICKVWTKQQPRRFSDVKPWPEGEANFALILKAPQMLAALEAIREKAEYMMSQARTLAVGAGWQAVRDHANTAIAAAKGEDVET